MWNGAPFPRSSICFHFVIIPPGRALFHRLPLKLTASSVTRHSAGQSERSVLVYIMTASRINWWYVKLVTVLKELWRYDDVSEWWMPARESMAPAKCSHTADLEPVHLELASAFSQTVAFCVETPCSLILRARKQMSSKSLVNYPP
jgi:hypothetical protein